LHEELNAPLNSFDRRSQAPRTKCLPQSSITPQLQQFVFSLVWSKSKDRIFRDCFPQESQNPEPDMLSLLISSSVSSASTFLQAPSRSLQEAHASPFAHGRLPSLIQNPDFAMDNSALPRNDETLAHRRQRTISRPGLPVTCSRRIGKRLSMACASTCSIGITVNSNKQLKEGRPLGPPSVTNNKPITLSVRT
jgi:hypothetical protein